MIISTIRVINQFLRGYISPLKINSNKTINVEFRCWPIDIDSFFHMNNSKYLQTAELSRWRMIGKIFPNFFVKGVLFLVAENRVQYIKPIQPFQKYVISTSVSVDENDDKWMYYKHVFEEHPDDTKVRVMKGHDSSNDKTIHPTNDVDNKIEKDDKKIFAIVEMKSVVKEMNGKTIRPSVFIEKSAFFKDLVSFHGKRHQ